MVDEAIRTVPLICGRCGLWMAAKKEQVVYQCSGCGDTWELAQGQIAPRKVVYLSGNGDIMLPFWNAEFRIACQEGAIADTAGFMALCGLIKSLDDLATIAPQLYVPAFALPPQQAIRIGRNMTVRFPRFSESAHAGQPFMAVTICERDVQQLAELIVLAAIVEGRRNNPDFLASFGVELSGLRLVAIPFTLRGRKLYQAQMNLEV
ncbi:MAG: hypothetical protein WC156_06040 [Pedobacter sp.]